MKRIIVPFRSIRYLVCFLCLSMGSFLGHSQGFQEKGSSDRPNILMISIDDLNDWVGAMGYADQHITPNIDKLADRGVLFNNAHCQAPICGPSRASIMTGLRPSTTGIYGMIDDNNIQGAIEELGKSAVFLPEYFKKHGYKTMGVGKIFHQHAPDGILDESGGRVGGFGPRPAGRFHWEQPKTSTDWGPFPESDEMMPDRESARWAIEKLREVHEKPFF